MKAGQTEIKIGQRVRIKNIKGEDKFLNGLQGTATHPFAFGCTDKGWIGVYLEGGNSLTPYGGKANVRVSEIDLID